MRIALFTPFSPELGGGSAQLRSHLRFLPELDVQWHYLANQPAKNVQYKWLGPRLTTTQLLKDLAARTGFLPGSRADIKRLVGQMDADLYWVVGHYEGISVAAELIAQGKKVHLTVHDDPFATWTRSRRYRIFRPLLAGTFPEVLRAAQSIDVTSWGMRNLYRQKYAVKCFSLYLHIAALPQLDISPDQRQLTVGHIGTLYHPEPFRRFLSACKNIAAEKKRRLRIVRIGASPEIDAIADQGPGLFEFHGDVDEESAIPLLAACDLLYAMYPAGEMYELFRRTSLPVKVSTYIQAQRPIFAHTPPDSTLACVVRKYKIGQTCESQREGEIAAGVRTLLETSLPRENYELARAELTGLSQVQQLGRALNGKDWQNYPESDCP
ncbi:MAG TPA: hypothetical protein VIW23_00880 [Candidatus Acidoferrum sp.]